MNRWNERYAGEDFLFGTAPSAFLVALRARLPQHGTALAVADGEGRDGVWLAEQGLDVLGVDASDVGLVKSRRLAAERGVRMAWELADLSSWDFGSERFDVIAALFIQFADPALRARLFAGMSAALKPGGVLLPEGYRPEQLGTIRAARWRSPICIPRRCCARRSRTWRSSTWPRMTPRSTRATGIAACRH